MPTNDPLRRVLENGIAAFDRTLAEARLDAGVYQTPPYASDISAEASAAWWRAQQQQQQPPAVELHDALRRAFEVGMSRYYPTPVRTATEAEFRAMYGVARQNCGDPNCRICRDLNRRRQRRERRAQVDARRRNRTQRPIFQVARRAYEKANPDRANAHKDFWLPQRDFEKLEDSIDVRLVSQEVPAAQRGIPHLVMWGVRCFCRMEPVQGSFTFDSEQEKLDLVRGLMVDAENSFYSGALPGSP